MIVAEAVETSGGAEKASRMNVCLDRQEPNYRSTWKETILRRANLSAVSIWSNTWRAG